MIPQMLSGDFGIQNATKIAGIALLRIPSKSLRSPNEGQASRYREYKKGDLRQRKFDSFIAWNTDKQNTPMLRYFDTVSLILRDVMNHLLV